MARPNAPEQRTVDVDVQDIDTRGRTLHGYAAVYGTTSEDLGGFRERIAAGAFADVLDSDVRALLNHDPSQVLGRTRSGTLRLHDEQRGLRFEIDLPESPLGENVRASVARGDIDGASFRFTVNRDSWDGDLRTVESVKELKDITVATFAAYPSSSVELRTRPTDPATGQEDKMADTADNQQQAEDEQRGVEVRDPGSLRVEQRNELPAFRSLADAFEKRGFPNTPATVSWDEFRLLTFDPGAYESRTLVWSGGTALSTLNPYSKPGVPLGYDTRWAYPAFPSTGVDAATTSIQYLRQSDRVMQAGTAVVRVLDSVATKPEVSGTATLITQQLSQVAAIQSNIPNIIGAQPAFQSMIETDLRLQLSEGFDSMVWTGIGLAGTLTYGTADILTCIRKGITQIAASGYTGTTLIIDAAGAEKLDLLQTSGTEKLWVFGAGNFAPSSIFGLNRRVTKTAGTAIVDANAFGRLYSSPLQLQSFEADAGTTNRRNVRLEANATFAVERTSAGVRII